MRRHFAAKFQQITNSYCSTAVLETRDVKKTSPDFKMQVTINGITFLCLEAACSQSREEVQGFQNFSWVH